MSRFMSFVCPDLNTTYEAIYLELAVHLELDLEETVARFAPDDAVARVRYFRRQASRRGVQQQLADRLGIDAGPVFAACTEEGARILLEALQARQDALMTANTPGRWSVTTRAADHLLAEFADKGVE